MSLHMMAGVTVSVACQVSRGSVAEMGSGGKVQE